MALVPPSHLHISHFLSISAVFFRSSQNQCTPVVNSAPLFYHSPMPVKPESPLLWLGTSSFTAEGWEKTFYPPGIQSRDYLSYYATQFNILEVDATFYRIPAVSTVKGWYAKTPQDFRFALKVPQICCGPTYVILISHRLVARGLMWSCTT